jgi:hypothetical protein
MTDITEICSKHNWIGDPKIESICPWCIISQLQEEIKQLQEILGTRGSLCPERAVDETREIREFINTVKGKRR